ncbi:MAG: FIST C-terminal domain-containing protein [Acidimicrobiia bacterium]|nr:FIST C-terminal domain-containing protein [Acidimicrobiia bacterium]
MDVFCTEHDLSQGWTRPLPTLSNPERTLVLAFGAADVYRHDPGPLAELRSAMPGAVIAGCSTAGEISEARVRDDSLSVAVVDFASARVRMAVADCRSGEDSFKAGESLADQLEGPDLAGVLVLSDGLHVNGSELVRGITSRLPTGIPVTGGLAADGDRFERTWVLVDDAPVEGRVTAVGFYGDSIRFHHGSQGGWDLFGPERIITRSEGSVLYELDGRPALELYKQYLGDLAEGLPATGLLFPLAVRQDPDDRHLVRTILAVDERLQSLTFAGDVPEGARAQLMQANFDRLVGGAEQAAHQARNGTTRPVLSIAISCVGRRLVLGDRTEEEIEATLAGLPAGSHQLGFYSYGEISPHSDGTCNLHNQTMTLTNISEDT